MQTGGVRERLFSPKQPFSGECPLCPSVSYGSGILRYRSGRCLVCVPLAHGTPFSPWMRKGGKRIIWGVILTRQAKSSCKQACGCISKAVRVAFLTRRSGIEKQPVSSRCYYFPTQAAYAGEKPAHRCQLSRGLGVDTVHPGCLRGRTVSAATSRRNSQRQGSYSHAKQIKFAPRLFTREISPLIDDAIPRLGTAYYAAVWEKRAAL